jgi:hypothetical protein
MTDPAPATARRIGDHVPERPRELRLKERHYGDLQQAIKDAQAHGYRIAEIEIVRGEWCALIVESGELKVPSAATIGEVVANELLDDWKHFRTKMRRLPLPWRGEILKSIRDDLADDASDLREVQPRSVHR